MCLINCFFLPHVGPWLPLVSFLDPLLEIKGGHSMPPATYHIQGDSKRLLKVHVSLTSIFHGVWDLKFCTEQFQNYTIWYFSWDGPMRHQSFFELVIIYLVNFKKKPKFGTKFWQKLIILFENFEIKTFLTDARFK